MNPLSNPFYLLSPLFVLVVSLILIMVVWRGSRPTLSSWLFCGVLATVGLSGLLIFGMRSSPDVHRAVLWDRVLPVVTLAAFVLYYHFTVAYTHTTGQRRILLASYLAVVLVGALTPTGLIIETMSLEYYGYTPVLGLFGVLPGIGVLLLMGGGAYNLLRRYNTSLSYEERNRLLYLVIALLFPLLGTLLDAFSNLPPAAIWGYLIFGLICSVAILRYHLLDIRIVVRKSLVYILTSATVAIPYVSMLLFLNQILKTRIEPWWTHAFIILLLAIILRPLYSWSQGVVDRFFYRDRYDYLKALQQFSHEAQSIVNLEDLGRNITRLVSKALRISSACLLLASESKNGLLVVSSTGLESPPSGVVLRKSSPLVKWLQLHGNILSSEQLDIVPLLQSFSLKERDNMQRMRAKLYVPIKTRQGQLSGILVLGEKLSQQPYSGEDKQLLTTVSNQMAIALDNAQLYQESVESEKVIRESEEKLRLTFDSIREGIAVTDLNGNILQVNEAVVSMHGYENRDELIGRSMFEFIDEKDQAKAMRNLKRTLEDGYVKDIEHTFLKRNGDKFPAELSTATLKDNSGNPLGFVAITEDITEHKQAEERAKQLEQELHLSSRLASIGQLAAGVAHEINNPLTGILVFAQRLLRKSTDKEAIRGLEIIHDEAQRAGNVVQNLLTFARRHKQKKEYSDVNHIVQKAIELRAYELKTSNIEVATDLAPNLPQIMVDFHQIQQVFLNIIVNAEQAITEAKGRGKLSIKTEEINGSIRISFTDDGPGIRAKQLNNLFDPFFTDRGASGGTGLGLSICHGIVTGHGGRIYARSKLRKGATFSVELPIMS